MTNETPEPAATPAPPPTPYPAPPPSTYGAAPPAGYAPAPGYYPPPPGGPAQPAWPAPARPVRSTRGLAVVTAVISSLAALSAVTMAVLSPVEADSMEAFVLGGPTGPRGLIGLYAVASISFAILFAVAAVLTMVWTGLVRANLLVLAPNARHQRAAAWAWLSWMVPVVQIWFPFQVIRDIRLGVDPETSSGGPRRVALIQLVVWWLSLVTMVLLTRITFLLWSGGSPTFSAAGQMRLFDPVVGALALISGVCWVLIIRAVERNQKQRRAEVSALASPGGLPR